MKQYLSNRRYLAKVTTAVVGGIYALLGWIGTFAPLDTILSESFSLPMRIALSVLGLGVLWIICFFMVGFVLINKKRFEVYNANNGHKVYLQYGDVFSEDVIISPSERRNILIPVNRCFDVIVDNQLVSEQTLHGMALKYLYEQEIFDENSLYEFIEKQLINQKSVLLSDKTKPMGNRKRFAEGTVVDIPVNDKIHYLFWALSSFDNKLKAQTTMEEYVLAVQRMIMACNLQSEGYPIVIPLVGAGLSRTKKNQLHILTYLVNAFKLNGTEINSDIHIVVNEKNKNDLSIMNIK